MNDQLKELATKKNIIGLLVLAILILAIPLGVDLIERQQILKSQAAEAAINFVGDNVVPASPIPVAIAPTIGLQLTPPWPLMHGDPSPTPTATGSATPSPTPTDTHLVDWGDNKCKASIEGEVFLDGGKLKKKEAGEIGQKDVKVTLSKGGKTESALTNTEGEFKFIKVSKGKYAISIDVPSGFEATIKTPDTIKVKGCNKKKEKDFGIKPTT